MSDAEAFLEALTGMFGRESHISRVDPMRGGPPVFVFYFGNRPQEGILTAVTWGLSRGEHPGWRVAKPELIVSLDTEDRTWGQAAAYFAAEYRGEKRFRYGDVFALDEPITPGSGMNGFVVFAPAALPAEAQQIELPGGPVNLNGLYPIYPEEAGLLRDRGFDALWQDADFDPYDVNRPNLGLRR